MRAAVVFLMGLLSAGTGGRISNAALIVLEDARYVSADGGTPIQPAPGASLFDGSASGVTGFGSQSSTLLPDRFSGVGEVYTDGGLGLGDSVFNVFFTVDAETSFELSGFVIGGAARTGFFSESTGVIHLLDGDSFALGGVLLPGTQYRLLAGIMSVPGASGNAGAWSLSLAIPEGPVVSLGIVGVTALLAARGRASHTAFQ